MRLRNELLVDVECCTCPRVPHLCLRVLHVGPGHLNAIRWNDWKVSFAVINGNIATGTRDVPGWPVITNLRADPFESASRESGMYIRWYGDNIWLFVPVQNKLKGFLSTLPPYPFQQGGSLSAANINYQTLKAAEVLKRLEDTESITSPSN